MIDSPVGPDDFYFHAASQKQSNTSICLDELSQSPGMLCEVTLDLE